MALESAADLAAYFAADLGGETGTYTPAGDAPIAGVDCLRDATVGDDFSGLGAAGLTGRRRVYWIRAAQLAAPAEGDALELDDGEFSVRAPPLADASGNFWRLEVAAA